MPKGLSVHIGVNEADSKFQVAKLFGCHKDAEAMRDLAVSNNFQVKGFFLDGAATFEAVKQKILEAADELQSGDMFLFTFSGHGSTQPSFDTNNEPDRQDETILLFDCILIDNYVRRNLWSSFKEGVRILGLADCCHAGSALFTSPNTGLDQPNPSVVAPDVAAATSTPTTSISAGVAPQIKTKAKRGTPRVIREITGADSERIVGVSPAIHTKIKNEISANANANSLRAKLMTLAACKDNEKALDGEDNGAFTKALLEILADSPSNYDVLMDRVSQRLKAKNIDQNPIRFPRTLPDQTFVSQLPFRIN